MKAYKINEGFKSKIGKKLPCFENFVSEKYGVELTDGDVYKTTEDLSIDDNVILPVDSTLTYVDEQGTFENNGGSFVSDNGYFQSEDGQQFDPEVLLSNEIIKKAEANEGGKAQITEITEEESQEIIDDKIIEGADIDAILTNTESVTDEIKDKIITATNAVEGDVVSVGDLVNAMVEANVPSEIVNSVVDTAVDTIVDGEENISESCKSDIKKSINESAKKRYRKAIFESKRAKMSQKKSERSKRA